MIVSPSDEVTLAEDNARLAQELEARTRELAEARQQQAATADVLKVISRSAFDLNAVFQTLIDQAAHLCGAERALLYRREGEHYRVAASSGESPELDQFLRQHAIVAGTGTAVGRVALTGAAVHIVDALADPDYTFRDAQKLVGFRTLLGVPLLREGTPIGALSLMRSEVCPFTERQIELVLTFADQAVIAIENVRLFDEVQARTRDLTEALQQQTATSDVLKVISRSAFDLQAVFDTLVASASRLCEADLASIWRQDEGVLQRVASLGDAPSVDTHLQDILLETGRGSAVGRALLERKVVHILDSAADPEWPPTGGFRTMLGVPLLREGTPIGVLMLGRRKLRPFSDRQIELVATFADQAVIAIENVRLFEQVQAKTRDLSEALQQQTATADVLKVISRSAFDLNMVLTTLIESAIRLCDATRGVVWLLRDGQLYLAAHVNYPEEWVKEAESLAITPSADAVTTSGLAAFTGEVVNVEDVPNDPRFRSLAAHKIGDYHGALGVPLKRDGEVIGTISLARKEARRFTDRQVELVQTFADQAVIAIENVRLFQEVEARTNELARSLDDLRSTQDRLIQTEKLASLGQLTAGIAHEIKNPLNFVNNFADLSRDLLGELNEVIGAAALDKNTSSEVAELTAMIKGNLEKVVQHGRRADSIVKNMLLHSRQGGGERRSIDLNAVVEESLNLAYHGARAEKPGFNITLAMDLDPAVGTIEIYPQEFTRVLLNLISNGFYAAHRKKLDLDGAFEPTLAVSTKAFPDRVDIRIRDNGTGIPDAVRAKMFNPFFTTKPAGEGTGLGLSLSHDIIVKQHGGRIDVETKLGEFTEFTISLLRAGAPARSGGSA